MGDNDVGREIGPEALAYGILAVGTTGRTWSGRNAKVVHWTMFPRYWLPTHEYFTPVYNQEAMEVNQRLRADVNNDSRYYVWHCSDLTDHRSSRFYAGDGVHLNDGGLWVLAKAIKSYQKSYVCQWTV